MPYFSITNISENVVYEAVCISGSTHYFDSREGLSSLRSSIETEIECFKAKTVLIRLINLSRLGQRKWNRVCQHGPSAGPDDSAYRPRDIVRSFTSLSIHAPAPTASFRPIWSLRRSLKGLNSCVGCVGEVGRGVM